MMRSKNTSPMGAPFLEIPQDSVHTGTRVQATEASNLGIKWVCQRHDWHVPWEVHIGQKFWFLSDSPEYIDMLV